MAGIIRQAVDKISPETRIGLMTAIAPKVLWGHDYSAVSKVLAGKKHKALIRPQIHPYNENSDLHNCAGYFRQPAIIREIYGGEIDIQPWKNYSKEMRFSIYLR